MENLKNFDMSAEIERAVERYGKLAEVRFQAIQELVGVVVEKQELIEKLEKQLRIKDRLVKRLVKFIEERGLR